MAKLLGEAIALTVLLGSALKIEGRFILQTQTDGPVRMLVVDFRTPGNVRACARFDAARVAGAIEAGKATAGALLGRGHLAMTIDQGTDTSRYQGLVALDGGSLEDAAHEYFLQLRADPDAGAAGGRRGDVAGAQAIVGAPAACCCSSCPSRRNARACPICLRATPRRVRRRMSLRRTMPGSRAAR